MEPSPPLSVHSNFAKKAQATNFSGLLKVSTMTEEEDWASILFKESEDIETDSFDIQQASVLPKERATRSAKLIRSGSPEQANAYNPNMQLNSDTKWSIIE